MPDQRNSQYYNQRRSMTQQDLLDYHSSLARELEATQNRVRNLIGSAHWQSDGEHKEQALRDILNSRLPEVMRVGSGFVCFPGEGSSGQIDILVSSRHYPTLYRTGDLVFVTATAVHAITEVKTKFHRVAQLRNALSILASRIEGIRRHDNPNCWCGLFVYEQKDIDDCSMLQELRDACSQNLHRVINCVCLGQDTFFHFWPNGGEQVGSPAQGPVWHSYNIEKLAAAYFLSNLVVNASSDMSREESRAWFPIEQGKESRRQHYIRFDSGECSTFPF